MFLFLATALFIFGPSCGGKSTLSKALSEKLESWIYLDRDVLIDEGICQEEMADQKLDEMIQSLDNVIIDTQVPWRAPKENELFVLVYAPLPILIERDEKRAQRLNRTPERSFYAREFVEKTFKSVFESPTLHNFQYNVILDSSQYSLDSEVREVFSLFIPT